MGMAEKKPKTNKAATAAKRKVKKAAKKNPKAFLFAIIAVVLVIAIGVCVLYFGFPDTWDSIIFTLKGEGSGGGDNPPLHTYDGELTVHFIDVGQGDCIFIQFPDGKEMIIDCANYNNSSAYKRETLEYLDAYVSDDQIDYMMLTHGDSDHVYFMDEVLERYQVDNIFMPNVLAEPDNAALAEQIENIDKALLNMFTDSDTIDTACYAEFFIAALSEPDCNIVLNVDADESTNSIVISEEEYTLTFYCPTQQYYSETRLNTAERKNAISPIGVLEYNGFRIVLTGDSNEYNEPVFVRRIGGYLDCDVLKVGHHGSESSSTSAFLDAIDCEYAVISCNAAGNNFNHPRQNTLDRFIERDMLIFRTDNNGNIVLSVTAELKFDTEKPVEQPTNQIGLSGK